MTILSSQLAAHRLAEPVPEQRPATGVSKPPAPRRPLSLREATAELHRRRFEAYEGPSAASWTT